MNIYELTGCQDSWRLVHASIRARSDREAKAKFRKRFARVQDIHIVYQRNVDAEQPAR